MNSVGKVLKKGRVPFTVPQIIFTSLSVFMYVISIVADVFLIYLERIDKGTYGGFFLKLNLIISAVALIVSLVLILKTHLLNPFSRSENGGNISEGIKVLRTYICMISLDISVTLLLMPLGLGGFRGAKIAVIIFAPVFFIISAIMYFVRAGRLGLGDFDEDDIYDKYDSDIFDDDNDDF